MSPDDIRERGLWPKGFLPSPHPFHPTGGFVFPQMEIDAMKRQDARHHQRHVRDRDHLGPVRMSFHDKVKVATERAILEATGQTGRVTCRCGIQKMTSMSSRPS